jgi:2-oxoisovalerate dehydrogenase E2 component (dihydrolipoyl transacylase)
MQARQAILPSRQAKLVSLSSQARDDNEDAVDDTNNNNNNGQPFLLADIGEGIQEVEVLSWHVQPGDVVQEFDVLCQVQSDKATVDITSRYAGEISALGGQVGEMIAVGTPLLYFRKALPDETHAMATGETEKDAPLELSSLSSSSVPLPFPSSATTLTDQLAADAVLGRTEERLQIPQVASHYALESDEQDKYASKHRVLTSPAVRKLAADYGINVATIVGSGPGGRVLKNDVLRFAQQQGRTTSSQSPESPLVASNQSTTISNSPTASNDNIIQLKGYHRYMVSSMTNALKIPHMTLGDEVIMDQLLDCRQRMTPKISVLAFLLKACSLALLDFPLLNASVHSIERCELQVHSSHHLGVAMDTPRGLVVPAVQNVESKSLVEIQAEIDHLKEQARSGIVDSKVLNPTFTLSNIGALGVGQSMQAVLCPPQVAMGAVGRVCRVPRFVGDTMEVTAVRLCHVSWSADHRVLDGATLARFHQRFALLIEDPVRMLVQLK